MVALSGQAITGLFTLAAALGGAAVVGLIDWRRRKGDRAADDASRREDRHAVDMAQWRDTGADVLGRVREFMTDVHPQRVTINFQPGAEQQVMQSLNAKWEAIREPIARLAVGHPSARARELADEVSTGLHRTLHWTGWAVSDLARHASIADAMAEGMKEWEQLNANVKELREALHEGS